MSSKQILTSIDPIAVAARAALERNREMLDRADSIAMAPKRVPEITLPDPESVREVEYDPDSVAASILLGEGTGSLPADLAIGLTGGAAGPITEAVGGKSGVLDWIPGGSLAKAMPVVPGLVARIIRRGAPEAAETGAGEILRAVVDGAAAPAPHTKEYAKMKSNERRAAQKAFMEQMDPEELARIKAEAVLAGEAKRKALVEKGETASSKLRDAYNNGIKSHIDKTIGSMMKANREADRKFMDAYIPYTEIPEEYRVQASEIAKEAAKEAWRNTSGDFAAKRAAYNKAYTSTRQVELRRLYPDLLRRRDVATANNLRYAFNTFDDDTRAAIRELAKEAANDAGAPNTAAYNSKYSTTLNSLIREEVRNRGYRSVNDPALQHADWFGGENPNVVRNAPRNPVHDEVDEAVDDIVRYTPEEIAEQERKFMEEYAALEAEENARLAREAAQEVPEGIQQEPVKLTSKERKELARQRKKNQQRESRNAQRANEAASVLAAGWKPEEHPLISGREYPEWVVGDEAKRNHFVRDSLAAHVLLGFDPSNPVTGESVSRMWKRPDVDGFKQIRHEGTNYDLLSSLFEQEIAKNAREHRLPKEYLNGIPADRSHEYRESFRNNFDTKLGEAIDRLFYGGHGQYRNRR